MLNSENLQSFNKLAQNKETSMSKWNIQNKIEGKLTDKHTSKNLKKKTRKRWTDNVYKFQLAWKISSEQGEIVRTSERLQALSD